MILRYYQTEMIQSIFFNLKKFDSVLCQSATGSGKTVIMSEFIRQWVSLNPNKKVLVSVHRDELVNQTSQTLAKFGILNEKITAKSKNDFKTDVYVGMTQTIWSRKTSLDIGLMIIDEAHEQIHLKTFDLFKGCKRVGFTATPIINKRITYYKCNYCERKYDTREICCYNEHVDKWGAPVTMSQTYDNIITGIPISKLIEEGSLVDEVIFSYDYYSELKAKGDDDFDENEIAEESVKHDDNVLQEYEEKAKGKKTMIFTASTKQNLSLVNTFRDYQIKSYDSVNNDSSERVKVVEWFKETDGAILVSTGTFTTGFDVKEVECIIINRPTKSLSLWHQIVGRGARTSDLIFKDNFIVIDLGGNVSRLGKWSDEIDWRNIFFNGLIPEKKKKELLVQCEKCGYNWIGQNSDNCPDCGHKNQPQIRITIGETGIEQENEKMKITTTALNSIPMPNGRKIAEFVQRTSNSKNEYFKIIIDKYIDLWKLNRVPVTIYESRIKNGTLESKIMEYLKKYYGFVNILREGVPRTYKYLVEKIKEKLKACFIVNR